MLLALAAPGMLLPAGPLGVVGAALAEAATEPGMLGAAVATGCEATLDWDASALADGASSPPRLEFPLPHAAANQHKQTPIGALDQLLLRAFLPRLAKGVEPPGVRSVFVRPRLVK
jgi:hypothetical protein